MSVYRRILRATDQTHPHWVVLPEEECVGEHFHTLRKFWVERGLSLSDHGHSVTRGHMFYQVFMSASDEDAEVFRKEFDGERMQPSEKGKGKNWPKSRKGK
jgi:hypothetical protein